MEQMIIQNQFSNNTNYIQIRNGGGFVAEFYVTYLNANGQAVREDSGAFLVGQTRRINIASGTAGVNLRVEIWIFGGKRIMYDNYIDTTTSHCFVLYKSIFDAVMDEIPCGSSDDGSSPTPPTCTPCCCTCCCTRCRTCCKSSYYRNY